ncbi:DNA polymerase III subunit delta [Desulfococcus multivorans]|nr:hypothetical protein [Desulfococcus multivorans]AOY58829.1 HolA: putative DNA-directed DNA polymerase III, subunit delta [Desulfococcus multivorans]
MPEIPYNRFKQYLGETPTDKLARIWLIHGEEALCKDAADGLVNRLLPGPERSVSYDIVDNDDIGLAVERVSTFSLFSVARVIALMDSRIFYSREDHQKLFRKAREAMDDEQVPKAARHFLAALGLVGLSPADAGLLASDAKGGRMDPDIWGDGAWVATLSAWCLEKGLSSPADTDRSADLQQAVEGGFPTGNYLLITTDLVDRRRGLYKTILEKGVVVNCSVPMGSGRKDVAAREALLADHARSILSESRKQMAPAAWRMMLEMIGFDLRGLTTGLEKLIRFTGDAPIITAPDVAAVLRRTRRDPVYELTGALSERNVENALFYLDALLEEGLVPLQILAAMVNAVRRMVLALGFMTSPGGSTWKRGISYTDFQRSVMPAVTAYDEALLTALSEWDETRELDADGPDVSKKLRRGAAKPRTDLLMAPKGRSPYPVYLLLKNAERFTLAELIEILKNLQETDINLKTSGGSPRRLLESVIIRICRGR